MAGWDSLHDLGEPTMGDREGAACARIRGYTARIAISVEARQG